MLTPRQKILYKDVVTIYKMTSTTADGSKVAQDPKYAAVLNNVPCHLFATPEVDEPQAIGRNKQVNIFTLDVFNFAADVDIADTYVIQLLTPNHPQKGLCWMVEGNSKLLVSSGRRHANVQMVLCKRIPVPETIAA